MDVLKTPHLRVDVYKNDTSIRDIAAEKVKSQSDSSGKVREVIEMIF